MDYLHSSLSGEYLDRRRRKSEIWFSLLLGFFTLAVAFLFLFNVTVSVCSVDGDSMMNTLSNGDTVLMQKHFDSVERGDVVTIANLSTKLIIKRVIALEGDKLVFRQDENNPNRVELFRDIGAGYVRLNELDYIKEGMSTIGWGIDVPKKFKEQYKLAPQGTQIDQFFEYEIQIYEGECFVMGDNRNDSSDSRYYGAGKLEDIMGKMFYRVKKDSLIEKILLFVYREKD